METVPNIKMKSQNNLRLVAEPFEKKTTQRYLFPTGFCCHLNVQYKNADTHNVTVWYKDKQFLRQIQFFF